ncbi:putative dehydrogenase [Microbacteriaceae bacterium SG_E_30_P1]|uniref:Dehydrogenase n=1 Tax=Antiquaquibacter oligotrophicus TaxID=2880260 RepID=A0ABT6KRX2_9MICO|nr:Gfo/Idh/MocA family oxidoreductase [Antiquaquibacter oligotrophicus]MDH6181952.1 putative dehydrogenase [Antiquaquibacter oligotrophicus]UDF12378.1 Gfo/Idh/MocA family oxidoreductase [Antiquaquibacter oligotrophicus]
MTGTGPVGVGIIGAGVISTQYLDNLTTFPDVRVLFIADLDTARAEAQAEAYGVPAFGTTEELLAQPDIEIVVNLTIPAVHVAVARQALEAGKNVWTEKPIALDRESGAELLADAQRRGLRVATAPDTFLGAGLQAGRRLIADGRIGTPLTALTLFQVPGPEAWHPNPDFLYAKGAGPLFDMGPYYVTTLVQNLGPVGRVAATASMSRERRTIASGPRAGETFAVEVPTHVSAMLEFEGGASAQCVFSFQSHLARAGFVEIAGTEGTVVFPDPNMFDGELTVWGDAAEPETIVVESDTGRGTGVVDLARAIRADVPERASGELAFHVLDVLVSITEAAERGEFVPVTSTVEVQPPLPDEWDPRAATL